MTMSNLAYRLMVAIMVVEDTLFPHVEKRAAGFGLRPGMIVVDYACGPGRYSICYARLVGPAGKVYAVDIHPLAIDLVRRKSARLGLSNIEPVLAHGYTSGLPDHFADLVTAIDVFFAIPDCPAFLTELRRITKPEGLLIIDDGHQPRSRTLAQLTAAGSWKVVGQDRDHLKCVPA